MTTWVELESLSDFYVKRSGAQVTLSCGPCSQRCGSWPVLNLADVVDAAVRHSGTSSHVAAAADASRQGGGRAAAADPETYPGGIGDPANIGRAVDELAGIELIEQMETGS